jgi:hypothetical protein
MNSDFMLKQAERLATRLQKEVGNQKKRWIEAGTRIVFGRPPSAEELQGAETFLSTNDLASLCLLWFNTNEYLYVD